MENWICKTCGTQFPQSEIAPSVCPICTDPRQYVGYAGQEWTHQAALHGDGFHNVLKEHEPHIIGIGTQPSFAIGQRALLLQTAHGNILWDCISLLDDETVQEVNRLGGIQAMAISHPHFYSSMVDWATRFDVTIHIHESNRQYIMRPDERVSFWSEQTLALTNDVTLICLGGHFAGSSVLHWKNGADGNGILCTGDTIQVVADRNWVSFMRSYPNLIPLPIAEIERMRAIIKDYDFERLYGGWFDRIVSAHASDVVLRSADRYIRALRGELF